MPFKPPLDWASGELAATIAAVDMALPLVTDQGARFGTYAAGEFNWGTLITPHRTAHRGIEVFRCTGRGGDSLTVGARGLFGTEAQPFLAGTRVMIGRNLFNRAAMMDGVGVLSGATALTLTALSPNTLLLDPAAPIIQPLPKDDVWLGKRFRIVNLASDPANTVTVKADDTTVIAVVPAGRSLEVFAAQDEPEGAGHWKGQGFFDHRLLLRVGGGAARFNPGGVIHTDLGPFEAEGQFLTLHTVPGQTAVLTGRGISAFAFGAELRVLRALYGTSLLANEQAGAASHFVTEVFAVRDAAGTQRTFSHIRQAEDDTGSTVLADVAQGTQQMASAAVLTLDAALYRMALLDSASDLLRFLEWATANFAEQGTPLEIVDTGIGVALAGFGSTTVIELDSVNQELKAAVWGGASWTEQAGTGAVANCGWPAVAVFDEANNLLAVIDSVNAALTAWTWDDTNFAEPGTPLPIAGLGNPALCRLNATHVALLDSGNQELRAYGYNSGTGIWALVGNPLPMPGVGTAPVLARMSDGRIAVFGGPDGDRVLRVGEWDGADFTIQAGTVTLSGTGTAAMTGLSPVHIGFFDNANRRVHLLQWSPAGVMLLTAGLTVDTIGTPALATLAGTAQQTLLSGFLVEAW